MSQAPAAWIKKASPEAMAAGLARDQAEEAANRSADEAAAPACPGCGRPVADKEWDRHRREVHNARQVVQPYGRADSREVLFTAPTRDLLHRKIQDWREKHPGCAISWLGDGKDLDNRLIWVRGRVRAPRRRILV